MGEREQLRVGFIDNNRTEVWAGDDYLVATVWPNDFYNAGEIVAAVNAYDPNAQRATLAFPATLERVSESQWIPLPCGAINVGTGNVAEWGVREWLAGGEHTVGFIFVGSDKERILKGVDAELFLRHMANAMGDAFPAGLRKLLA